MKIEIVVAYVSTGSVILPLVLAICQVKHLQNYSRLILLLLLCSLLADVLSYFLSRRAVSTTWIANVYLLIQFIILGMIYFHELKHRRILMLIALFFISYFVVDAFFFSGFFNFNTHANGIASLILVGISVYYLFQLLNKLD